MLLAVALALAGCLGGEPVAETASVPPGAASAAPTASTSAPDARPVVDVPVWAVGDAWDVESYFGESPAQAATLVVTAAGADAYTVSTTSEETASFDAAFDISYLGRIRASDLAGAQKDQPVQFFSFPLEDGKSWTATWDGRSIAITATFAPDLPTPIGPQPGFRIVGVDEEGADYVRYDYVPALRWWSHLQFTEGYGFTVKAARANWTGEYAAATAKPLLTLTTAAPVASTPGGAFTVEEGATSVLMTLAGRAGPFVRGLAVVDPAGTVYPKGSPNYESSPEPAGFFVTETMPAVAGEWYVVAPALHAPDGGFMLSFTQITVTKQSL